MMARRLRTLGYAGSVLYAAAFAAAAAAQMPRRPTNVQTLQRLEVEFASRYQREHAAALEWAGSMPMREVRPDGSVVELIGIRDGRPYFYITHNAVAADTVSTDELWVGGSTGLDLDGTGVLLHEWDEGAVRATHQEFGGRVAQIDGAGVLSDHSTHVAGTMVAAGVDPAAHGMAPAATLNTYEWNNDDAEMAAAAAAGAVVSNNSYGFVLGWDWWRGCRVWYGDAGVSTDEVVFFGLYTSDAQSWDQIASNAPNYLIVKSAGNDRDNFGPGAGAGHYHLSGPAGATCNGSTCAAIPCNPVGCPLVFPACSGTCTGGPAPGSRCCDDADCQYVWHADTHLGDGNSGTGFDSLGPRATAKNILTVGAVLDIPGGYTQAANVPMTAFSCWGPTDDGRIKPDIVANGFDLRSSGARSDVDYLTLPGTSMATPNVSGSLALLVQHYRSTHGNTDMRSATLKAIAIHTADEAGPDDGPDYQFGWGLFNAQSAADLISKDVLWGRHHTIQEFTLRAGQTIERHYAVVTGTVPLKATLCWTDPPGTPPPATNLDPPTPMLVNDLDLRIIDPRGVTYRPWILNPANPPNPATMGDNDRDNVEVIQNDNPPSGSYTVRISHKGGLTNAPQDFSLILSGFMPRLFMKLVPRSPLCVEPFCSTQVFVPIRDSLRPDVIYLDVWLSGWRDASLWGIQWQVDSAEFSQSVGCDPEGCYYQSLIPRGWPDNPGLGAFIDKTHEHYAFAGIPSTTAINTQTKDYQYIAFGTAPSDIAPDPGTPRYVGTVVLDTSGIYSPTTFTIGFLPEGTELLDSDGNQIVIDELVPAEITFLPDNTGPCWGVLDITPNTSLDITPNTSVTFDNSSVDNTPAFPYSCGLLNDHDGTLWYKFTATRTSARIHTCDSVAQDSTFAIFTGNCIPLVGPEFQEIACSENDGCGANGTLGDQCLTDLVPGETYYIQISAWSSADRGEYTLTVESPCPDVPTGACCQGAGQFCDDLTAEDCALFGGQFQGAGTSCDGGDGMDPPCAPAAGVCCLNGDCVGFITALDCQEDGGEWFEGQDCSVCASSPPCTDCGPGDHWIHTPPWCPPGSDSFSSGATVRIDFDFDCLPDTSLRLHGPTVVTRSGPLDDSLHFPGTRANDGHMDVIDTEIVSMRLANAAGATMTAGSGVAPIPLEPTYGAIAEQAGDPALADSFFDVFFEIEDGNGMRLYNHTPLRVWATIDCVPPDTDYTHPADCLPLYDSPLPGEGFHVANLVTANHDTYLDCGSPAAGDCFDPNNGTPYCDAAACCEQVCDLLPHCCAQEWDATCASEAAVVCDRCVAVRNLSDPRPSYCSGVAKTIHIVLNPPVGARAIGLQDSPPDGWTVVNISDDGVFDSAHEEVKWGPFFEPFPAEVTYEVLPPEEGDGPACFSGIISVDGLDQQAICGDECIEASCCPPMAADSLRPLCEGCGDCSCSVCEDRQVGICEVIGYACAWKKGCNEDLAGMTRSAYIWKNGECYCFDDAQAEWFSVLCADASPQCCPDSPGMVAIASVPVASHRIAVAHNPSPGRMQNAKPGTARGHRYLYAREKGLTVPITINAPAGSSAVALEYSIPEGWMVSEVSDGGQWDDIHRKVKWGPFLQELSRTVTFTAYPLTDRASLRGFTGMVSVDGVNQRIVEE